MENPFYVVLAKFPGANKQKYVVEVIVKFYDDENCKTIGYLQHPERKEDVKVFENFSEIAKRFLLMEGKWRKCTKRELKMLNSKN
ncbi:MAG: hypothetical protein EBS19_14325 [Spirochaetia bacterium]|nr:hypothetical protein [Spirochaetia bacterium]